MTEPDAQRVTVELLTTDYKYVNIFKGIKEESKKNHIANIYVVNIYKALL